ncbi:MAG: hypothetical protein J1F66_05255 [Clostridiales bacterium]|nr:hypothetical protein [Clostridiales bacterium]
MLVDTRPLETFDDFEAFCVSNDGKTEIDYEDYLALSKEENANYTFDIRYTPNELILTDELIAKYEQFLVASDSESIKEQYAELVKAKIWLLKAITMQAYTRCIYWHIIPILQITLWQALRRCFEIII